MNYGLGDDDERSSDAPSSVVPALQMVGLAAVVGVAIADLMIDGAEVPWIVYGLIGSIVIGVAPENLWRIVRGGNGK